LVSWLIEFTGTPLVKTRKDYNMKKKSRYAVPVITIVLIAIASMMISDFLKAATQRNDLVSLKVTSAPRIDGSGSDTVWGNAPEFKVQAKDGPELSLGCTC
jgi:hypothetical protein